MEKVANCQLKCDEDFFAEKSDSVKWNDQYLSMRLSIATYTGKRGME